VADFTGAVVFTFPDRSTVSLDTIGPNGVDRPLGPTDGIHPYVIADGMGVPAILMSPGISVGGVIVPVGWTLVRKLPFGVVLRNGEIPNFHCSFWPMPRIDLTGVIAGSSGSVLSDAKSADWAPISLASWVPDNARHAYLHCEVGAVTQAGTAYLRAMTTGLLNVGNANPSSGVRSLGVFPIELRSDRTIDYKTSGDARLTAKVIAYSMTEPTT
jgi:hypothetical protein